MPSWAGRRLMHDWVTIELTSQIGTGPMDTTLVRSEPTQAAGTGIVVLFTATSFLTASLLFIVQPMVGRMVLPAFGGSPQVWTTSMLFFQTALLVGYGYTHLTTTRLHRGKQPWVHLSVALLPALLLPITLTVAPSGRGGITPSFELLAALTVGVAAPFILIATSGPLVQRWFSWTDHPRANDPYFLYAAGNIGSAVGLLSYPFVLEPAFSIEAQSRIWAAGYLTALALLASCAWVVRRSSSRRDQPTVAAARDHQPSRSRPAVPARVGTTEALDKRRALRWVGLAFVPSSLMLAATTTLSTDIAAVPLLWIAPLGTYLLTFTVAFSIRGPRAYLIASFLAPAVILAAITIRPLEFGVPLAVVLQIGLVLVGGLVAHGRLAADRPEPELLTRFYLLLAVGGALGGLFNSIIAPLLFPTVIEYGIIAFVTLALVLDWSDLVPRTASWSLPRRLTAQLLVATIPLGFFIIGHGFLAGVAPWILVTLLGAFFIASLSPPARGGAVGIAAALIAFLPQAVLFLDSETVERTFFGVHRVTYVENDVLGLLHGTTLHGTQNTSSEEARRFPMSYYHPEQPFGDIIRAAGSTPNTTIGVLGLGVGGIAAYGQATQTMVFHEIDPAVIDIAWNQFSFLGDSAADIQVILGDGRLTLADVRGTYSLLVMDAFTSDAVPVHLLTVEAMREYLDAITADGVIAVNISNRYLDLRPVMSAAVEELAIDGALLSGDGEPDGATPSTWVALSANAALIDELRASGWAELPPEQQLWTDQRSSLFSVLR